MFVKLVRNTEKRLLSVGSEVVPLAFSVQMRLQSDVSLETERKADLEDKLKAAIEAHQAIEKQSRRLVNGKALPHCKIVNAYDATIAPIKKGKSNCATQFGKSQASLPRWVPDSSSAYISPKAILPMPPM